MLNKDLKLRETFDAIVQDITAKFLSAPSIPAMSWQSGRAPMPMPELFNYSFTLDLLGVYDLDMIRAAILPNLPWADNHFFKERVSGAPLNPGTTWREWPYAASADRHRRPGEADPQFDHSYAERYWPKYAGMTEGGILDTDQFIGSREPHQGIRFPYGDLKDLIQIMGKDPLTRQGYLPVWFPEDLAAANDNKRVPCTLGYHFIRRDDRLHCIYPMRSCDFIRHFRDDVYLTIRLQIWLLNALQYYFVDNWKGVEPGTFTMHITSLHMFEKDRDDLIARMKG